MFLKVFACINLDGSQKEGGNFLNSLKKEGDSLRKGGSSSPGGNYDFLWFWSYWDLKIWSKCVHQGEICHFEFTFSTITIVLVIILFEIWYGQVFWGWEIQKSHLEDLKNKPVLDFRFSVLVTGPVLKNTCGRKDNWKKNSLSIDINLSLSQKWLLVLF